LDYARATFGGWDFWGKLRDSVRDVTVAAAKKSDELAVSQREPSAPEASK
jgi:hypothetical protein